MGELPSSLEKLTRLKLSLNGLKGELPPSLAKLTKLQVLDISSNHYISGAIPPKLGNLRSLVVLDLSYNSIIGSLPSTLGQLKKLESLILAGNNLEGVFGAGFIYYIKRSKTSSVTPDPKHGDIFKIWNYDGYEDVIQSTADFDLRYCIEAMEVFTGRVVAVKKLHRFEGENPTYDMCFRNEAKVLSEIRHRNIVKLFGFCLHDYMET
ncbi:hypothetical protein ACS0TY_006907 [Phlomoides rotata]